MTIVVEEAMYFFGLCIGLLLLSGFRYYTVSVVIGVIIIFISLIGFVVKICKYFKDKKSNKRK